MNTVIFDASTETSLRNLGADIVPEGVRYTVWAPERTKVEIHIHPTGESSARILTLQKIEGGYFTGIDAKGHTGDRYMITIDEKSNLPDLASLYQPEGLSGPSMVVDFQSYAWKTTEWKRPAWKGHVIYEMHVGTFTEGGTFQSALERLDYLVDLGITVIEIMPVAECTGERNWGYDGVLLFAPYHAYGSPDDMRTFIDACHAHGLAVMLDVVYNHIGAVGDVTDAYSKFLTHSEDSGAWGKSFNLDGKNSAPVRHLLLQNIRYWLEEFRVDGFRLDATSAIRDKSAKHLIMEASELIHSHGAFVTAEDDRNSADLLKPIGKGGWQLDALWADDFHHTMRVSQTKENHSYLGWYSGTLEEITETLRHGWYFRGQDHPKLNWRRGSSCDHLPPEQFIHCISNHDQTGNRPYGERLNQSIPSGAYRALSLFFCFTPYTPLLFMGQEWAASSPFLFFTDHPEDFGHLVTEGRKREFQFEIQKHSRPLPNCQDEATFRASKLKWEELNRPPHHGIRTLYREALRLRRKFFEQENPPREYWKVEATSDHLTLAYQWPTRSLEVIFRLSRTKQDPATSNESILMWSNDPRFGVSDQDIGPETVISTRNK